MGDLFPRKALHTPLHHNLHRGVAEAAKSMGLQSLEEQTTKIDQLHETMEVSSTHPSEDPEKRKILFLSLY